MNMEKLTNKSREALLEAQNIAVAIPSCGTFMCWPP